MNPVLVHLRLTHFPIVGALLLFLLFVYAYFFKKQEVILACKVGYVLLTLITIPVFLTGEPTEEKVEHAAGFDHEEIEEHEEHAKQAFGGIIALGLLSLVGLFLRKNENVSKRLNAFIIPVNLVVVILMFIAGMHGGKIRHSEINGDAPAVEAAAEEVEIED
jgi:uncharacterized membrane protein